MNNSLENKNVNNSNIRLYSILSYIGILWIVGILVKEKDNNIVKFHVGQGILVSILSIIISTISSIIGFVIGFTGAVAGVSEAFISLVSGLLGGVLGLIPLAFMIIGIINASKYEKKELPIIGKFAFYK